MPWASLESEAFFCARGALSGGHVDYRNAIQKVLEHEGGYVNHPADRGGPTNWGVTQRTYDSYMSSKLGRPYKSTIAEIQAMPIATAIDIYKKLYWDVVKGDKIRKYSVALVIFDQAINRGNSAAIRQVQRVLGVAQDGIMGPQTLDKLNFATSSPDLEKKFLDSYLQESKLAYNTIVKNNPSQVVFLSGWLKRVDSLISESRSYLGTINATTVVGIGVGVVIILVGSILIYQNRDVIASYFNPPQEIARTA
jgi:lysozyme family protein